MWTMWSASRSSSSIFTGVRVFPACDRLKIFNGIPAYDVRARQMKNEGDKLAFLYMGRIDESKGVHRLIEVFSEIQGVELWLGGKVTDPAMKRRLEEEHVPIIWSGLY